MTERRTLERADWIAAAFRALATDGAQAIRAERLARGLDVSKGSFYWHFADVPALKAAMLAHWETQATVDIVQAVETAGGTARARLDLLLTLATSELADPYGGLQTEAAIRDWARYDPAVAVSQARVDRGRLAYIGALLQDAGIPAAETPRTARLLLGGYVGALHLNGSTPDDMRADLATLADALIPAAT